jgi:hypothetical protein
MYKLRLIVLASIFFMVSFTNLSVKADEPAYCVNVLASYFVSDGLSVPIARLNTKTGEVLTESFVGIPPETLAERSPDGKHIAFWNTDSMQNKFTLYVSESASPQPIKVDELTSEAVEDLWHMRPIPYLWSPNGQYLAYLKLENQQLHIVIVNSDGTNKRVQVIDAINDESAATQGSFFLGWSADSAYFADLGHKIHIWSLATSKLTSLDVDLYWNSKSEASPIIGWSQIGHKLGVVVNNPVQNDLPQFVIWSPEKGIELTQTLPFQPSNMDLKWLPNGELFSLEDPYSDLSNVFAVVDKAIVTAPNDKNFRQLIGWSAGNWITTLDYDEDTPNSIAELVNLNPLTGDFKVLDKVSMIVDDRLLRKVLISPDKANIAYVINDENGFSVKWSKIDGNDQKMVSLSLDEGQPEALHWSPDATYIGLLKGQLFSEIPDADSINSQRLAIHSIDGEKKWSFPTTGHWQWLSPDWLAYSRLNTDKDGDSFPSLELINLKGTIFLSIPNYMDEEAFYWTAISPDQQMAAIPTEDHLVLVPLVDKSSQIHELTAHIKLALPSGTDQTAHYRQDWTDTLLAWSSDSRMLAFLDIESNELVAFTSEGQERFRIPLDISDYTQGEYQSLFLNWTPCN